ncbi:hypothetical protein E8E12_007243 [Didymella heteroderae]|uniref:separase n=1 Tax=Didymella heteroderae TaxID=1769908 RepID=A0A9P4WX54_9PLEO|nr:hypothetical protein E8E12_007243 [Didymella heteroderae]
MAAQPEPPRTRIENVKSDLRATTSCTDTTVTTLRDLLSRRSEEPVQKENVGVKVPGALRRKADAAKAAARKDAPKAEPTVLAPREKYILATEVANLSLKTLADALKNQSSTPPSRSSPRPPAPADSTTRKAARPPAATQKALKERSVLQTTNAAKRTPASTRPSSAASSSSGQDPGLVATAECARTAFAYLGTAEAKKVVGKDGAELQVENGVLALIGKLVALGLDNQAVKEIRLLKRRLEVFLGHAEVKSAGTAAKKTGTKQDVAAEKEGLAALLHFGHIESTSPALPIVANLQTYTLRVIARLKKAPTIEASWEHLQLSNESSPANLLQRLASTSTGAAKAARQLESLAQIVLALCPSISALDDGALSKPSPETVLRLQHFAFTIRKKWWDLAKHKSNEERELIEPFTKCLVAYARRSKLSPTEKYSLSKSLSIELLGQQSLTTGASGSSGSILKTLCSLAQAAGLSDEALLWLGTPEANASSTSSAAKQACRLLRIATVSLEATNKGEDKPGLEEAISIALKALQGSLGGSSTDLDSLFMEANALRRAATRSLAAGLSARSLSSEDLSIQARAISMIAASVHFSARFIGRRSMAESESDPQRRHEDRINMAWKCTKSIVESVLTCCKRSTSSPELWAELDSILQDCSYILRRLGEEFQIGVLTDPQAGDVVSSCLVKLSNSYWNTYLQLRKAAAIDPDLLLVAMRRSIDLVSEGSETQQEAGHLAMKLERLGETLDSLQKPDESRKAFGQCIGYYVYLSLETLAESVAQHSLQTLFEGDGKYIAIGRLLKALHRSYLLHGVKRSSELAYHDDTYLQPDVRGAILEWQLILYSKTLSRNRQWDSNLNRSIKTLTDKLLDIYTLERYPVRRLRSMNLFLQLSQDHPHIVSHSLLPSDTSPDNLATVDFSEDEGLSKLKEHLSALCNFKLAMQQASPPTETLRRCFATWEFLAKSAPSWSALTERIGDIDSWIYDVRAGVDYLNAKGEEYLALPVLHLLVTIFELQNDHDASELVCSLSALSLQFLRLGYTGKAGLSFVKAELLVTRQTTSTEAKLKWYTAYAEYLFRIGNIDKCVSTLAMAESIARNDAAFLGLSTSSATISQRLRYNTVLADACYVYSLLAASKGAHKEAARYAKQNVTLNRRMWAALESKISAQKALAESDASILDGPKARSEATFEIDIAFGRSLCYRESAQQIAADFAFNTLPESTIAFPAIGSKDRRMSEGVLVKKATPTAPAKAKPGRGKKIAAVAKIDFTDTLRQAREHLLEVHALSATHGSNHLFQQVSNALGHITVLLSAVSEARGSVHPLYAAYTSEIPKVNAMRLAQEFVESEKEQMSREECLSWPLLEASDFSLASASDFQQEYIDIIPESWNAISLGLNEGRDELYVTRFEAGVAPFVLRLPLARHASRDLDEDEFTFEDGKRDFEEIIELSDFSTRGAKDMTTREARQQWWDEREALDTRLHELLVNMENIWLGGFKGVFSQHTRQPTLLAKFRKAFEDVLNRHLPSRSLKTQPKRPVLDSRVLELFVGLGDLAKEELDLDEALTDLIYFIVDILQFNGEANAYDEIDFDAMVIETQDALKAYHSAARVSSPSTPHTILMLDNNLHGFPWESLPCLAKLSISRLPSLAALRERLLALHPSITDEAVPGHYIAAANGGTTILNPGGDLANTTKTLQPILQSLRGDWTHISSRPPTETEFSHALGTRDLLLYFGHGSGAQFVRQKSVRKLYPGKQGPGSAKPGCATSFLFGCSSVHLTENGIYEPSGMLQSYLTAGAPAVVGMLWDVTDKDCDRFAVRCGELWGLWPEAEDEDVKPSKTPRKGKAKAKKGNVSEGERKGECRRGVGLDEAVRDARQACYLKYLNGAAAVVYGIPCYLE